jgi:hypothetical protein
MTELIWDGKYIGSKRQGPVCENATGLTGTKWEYVNVRQNEFERLQPTRLQDLVVLHV